MCFLETFSKCHLFYYLFSFHFRTNNFPTPRREVEPVGLNRDRLPEEEHQGQAGADHRGEGEGEGEGEGLYFVDSCRLHPRVPRLFPGTNVRTNSKVSPDFRLISWLAHDKFSQL